MGIDTIFAASLLDALPLTLCLRNNYVTFAVFSLLGSLPVVLPLVLLMPSSGFSPLVLLSSQLLRIFLSILSRTHLEYLHLVSALIRCYNSLIRSSGSVQTTLALWVRVLIKLYLAVRLWWLSHCKYWSMCMGFLYAVMDKELPTSGLTKVSRKGIGPFSWLPSTAAIYIINMVQEVLLLILSLDNKYIICIPHPKSRKGGGGSECLIFNLFHIQVS